MGTLTHLWSDGIVPRGGWEEFWKRNVFQIGSTALKTNEVSLILVRQNPGKWLF